MAAATLGRTSSGFVTTPLVLCGPSGSGKSTFLNMIMKEFPGEFGFSVSHTTRKPREGEVDGTHYHFKSMEEMERMKANDEFIESALVHGNMYGTSKAAVRSVKEASKICILDVDVQGVQAVKKTDLQCRYIFFKPPSLEVLEQRLRSRGTETEEAIQTRLGNASKEMEYGEGPGNFDFVLVNDDLQEAYQRFKAFVTQK